MQIKVCLEASIIYCSCPAPRLNNLNNRGAALPRCQHVSFGPNYFTAETKFYANSHFTTCGFKPLTRGEKERVCVCVNESKCVKERILNQKNSSHYFDLLKHTHASLEIKLVFLTPVKFGQAVNTALFQHDDTSENIKNHLRSFSKNILSHNFNPI